MTQDADAAQFTQPTDSPTEFRQTKYEAPPGATELLFVRHGASEPIRPGERFPLVDGHGDPELAPEGRDQAQAVARRLAVEKIDALYTTGLRRTVQTAEPIAELLGLAPIVAPGLREVRLGEWEGGLFRQKVHENGPIAQRLWAEERWDVIPGAESNEALTARVRAALAEILAAEQGRRVVVVAHGGVIGAALSWATGARPFAFLGADNCSVSHVFVLGDAWILRRFNDTAHLEPEFTVRAAPPA